MDLTNRFEQELQQILDFWIKNTPDHRNGGFYGKIDRQNRIYFEAPKGSVLNARILWSFSAAYNHQQNPDYLEMARRSYDYIRNYFVDDIYGGIYWAVDFQGRPFDSKNQIYALAFMIYGLSEFYVASDDENALGTAKKLFEVIEKYSFDPARGGYFEAFTQNWKVPKNLRLSTKDANEKKTMNTHLHILEAYANLYKIWPDEKLAIQIRQLLENFLTKIINPKTNRLMLFFDENWQSKSDLISYGHDIEASWLLLEAAEVLGDDTLITLVKEASVKLAESVFDGVDADGSLYYEFEPADNHLDKNRHWWVQAEALVGFLNAWQLTGNQRFYDQFLKSWQFIQDHIIDKEYGEWVWGVTNNYQLMPDEDKAGMWKCPYHNSRAMLEVIRRLPKN